MIKGKKIICDIDGTICTTINGDYEHSKPIQKRISKMNKLYRDNYIIYYTARGSETGINWMPLTHAQFKKWKVKFNEVLFGKPHCDIYIGDEATNDKIFFK